jgi:hypothetical protein
MRSSVFSYPYAKVFRRTQRTLSYWGLRLKSADALTGSIKAESGFRFLRPSMKVNLLVEEMENHDTKVTVADLWVKKGFFEKKSISQEASEAQLLESLSALF